MGNGARFVCVSLVVLLLMMSSAAAAVRITRASYLRLAKAWRVAPWKMLLNFYLPATLSQLAIALRAAIPLALVVAVAADMLIATDAGIGRILLDATAVFDTKTLYAGVFVVGLLGYIASRIGALIERHMLHWSSAS